MKTPIASRHCDKYGHARWTIERQKGLFAFRVRTGRRQHQMKNEVIAKFSANTPEGYVEGYFQPVDNLARVLVEQVKIQGKLHFLISWAGNYHYIKASKWTLAVEKKARQICKDRHLHRVFFYAEQRFG
jgi:hypothetical protein